MRVTVVNRGLDAAPLHLLPQLWARNVWSWTEGAKRPSLTLADDGSVAAVHPDLPPMRFHADGADEMLFCENDTNINRLYGEGRARPVQGRDQRLCRRGQAGGGQRGGRGTKCAAHYSFTLAPGETRVLRLRFRRDEPAAGAAFADFDALFATRLAETEEFYATLQRDMPDPDKRLVQRQALAGMLWSKQYYCLDVRRWLKGDPAQPAPATERLKGRNASWVHLYNADIISMPDTWEYPWYAAWDLAFHCVTFALIDPEFAKAQLVLLTREWYMHPNGQCRPMSGSSTTSTRRSMPGRPGGSSRWTAPSRAPAISPSSSVSSTS